MSGQSGLDKHQWTVRLSNAWDEKILISVSYAIFWITSFASLVWAQDTNWVTRHHQLQERFLKIIFCQNQNSPTNPLFLSVKSFAKTALENCSFIRLLLVESLVIFIFHMMFLMRCVVIINYLLFWIFFCQLRDSRAKQLF